MNFLEFVGGSTKGNNWLDFRLIRAHTTVSEVFALLGLKFNQKVND